jgi:hypothetical protein
MPLRPPQLDDRSFEDLVAEARAVIKRACPEWTDLSPGDPGMALVEVFAHLTEVLIYRLNRIPEKAYVEFLRLIGVQLAPPAAAETTLRFSLARPAERPVSIPRGTRVAVARASPGQAPVVFATAASVLIEAGASAADVPAHHGDLIQGELAGFGTGAPGLTVQVARPPIVAPCADGLDLVVAVEALPEEVSSARAVQHQGRTYRIWRASTAFTVDQSPRPGSGSAGPVPDSAEDPYVYVVDRMAGTITFAPALRALDERGAADAPAALAAVPPVGREIRVWYRRGGGAEGNVAAGTLTVLQDPFPGLSVTNPAAASGGRAAETLENALARGPQELHALERAVTARDFELIAVGSSGAVSRAHAFTRASLWAHAQPGTVEVLLVPAVSPEAYGDGPVTTGLLAEHRSESARARIQQELDRRKPLGTTCLVSWARYKSVRIEARLRVYREEDREGVKARVLKRLNRTVSPLPGRPSWPFGQALAAWDVYKVISAEPGVRTVSDVRLLVDEAPESGVGTLAADAFQPHTWYAGTGERLFRSMNDGTGWELAATFPGEEIDTVKPFPREASTRPDRAGLLAVATRLPGDAGGARLHLSRDCGETWESRPPMAFRVQDLAWVERDAVPALLLAAEVGLYELSLSEGAVPVQVLVDPANQDLGFYAVAVSTDVWGQTSVAVAAREERGVLLSSAGGRPGTFQEIGLAHELVRVLAVQHLGPHRYLWAGVAAPGDLPGKGCFRWRITGAADNPEGWRGHDRGWAGGVDAAGGCNALAFLGPTVLAASSRRGVLRLDPESREPAWQAPALDCGLPLRDARRLLEPVDAVATATDTGTVLAAGGRGVYRRQPDKSGPERYQQVSVRAFSDRVTVPSTWLFCSGQHAVTVEVEDEAQRD